MACQGRFHSAGNSTENMTSSKIGIGVSGSALDFEDIPTEQESMTRRYPGIKGQSCQDCLAHATHRKPESETRTKLERWLSYLVAQADVGPRPLHPCLQELQRVIESDTTIYMHCSSMFEQIPNDDPYTKDPIGRHQIKDYKHLLQLFNYILHSGPSYDSYAHELGWVGLPMNVIMNWPMSTTSGKALFLNDKFNAQLRNVLNVWGSFLKSRASTHVLHDGPGGWLSQEALKALMDEAHPIGLAKPSSFEEVYECDPSLPHHGFNSWDDFFSRRLRPGMRPVADPDDPASTNNESRRTIVNACEAQPFRVATSVAKRDKFWLKSQPYSLVDMLGHDPLAENFEGGTVYQGLLGSLGYHRYHAPVSGTVVRAFVQPGSYFSRAMHEGFGNGQNLKKDQGYVCAVATRGIVFIEADDRDIGLVAFIAVGLAEVSSVELNVKEGQHVWKGDDFGSFHYGGSTHCLIFMPGLDLEWVPGTMEQDNLLAVNSKLAYLKSRRRA